MVVTLTSEMQRSKSGGQRSGWYAVVHCYILKTVLHWCGSREPEMNCTFHVFCTLYTFAQYFSPSRLDF